MSDPIVQWLEQEIDRCTNKQKELITSTLGSISPPTPAKLDCYWYAGQIEAYKKTLEYIGKPE